jgi:hypothetical protein
LVHEVPQPWLASLTSKWVLPISLLKLCSLQVVATSAHVGPGTTWGGFIFSFLLSF